VYEDSASQYFDGMTVQEVERVARICNMPPREINSSPKINQDYLLTSPKPAVTEYIKRYYET